MKKIKWIPILNRVFVLSVFSLTACGKSSQTPAIKHEIVRSDNRPNVIFIYTDDHGYADLGVQGVVDDIKTPHLDDLAAEGVRMTAGYVTSPQCTPSRAGLMAGRYQQKFGVDDNHYTPFPLEQETIAEKFVNAGYKTGMAGKWHLEVDANSEQWFRETYKPGTTDPFDPREIPQRDKLPYYPENRGFQDSFFGYVKEYRTNYDLDGNTIKPTVYHDDRMRVDVVSDAAITFIDRHKEDPFFLYVAYYAPHVPLEASEKYLARFPGEMPKRRRYALAMLAAIDDGVGRIKESLSSYGIDEDTIIFFMSDNGAPLSLTKADVAPVTKGGAVWDGSLNEPWLGEKGMLTEGAIRVPYIVNWKGNLPEGLVYNEPVSTLDAAATAVSLANIPIDDLDGINLLPILNGTKEIPDRALYWRFWQQTAIRKSGWKYLKTGNAAEYLFDMTKDEPEKNNVIADHPGVAAALKQDLTSWAEGLKRAGVPDAEISGAEKRFYDFYF